MLENDSYMIKTESFEGPMDLLIDLIKKREMDIYNLSISTLTKDFMDQLEEMKTHNIEFSSNFLDLASLLLQIKTELLLPSDETDEDPRQILVKEIEEFQQYKQNIEKIKELECIENKFFKREKVESVKKKKTGSLSDIFASYTKMLEKKKLKETNKQLDELTKKLSSTQYTIEDKLEELKSVSTPLDVDDYFYNLSNLEESVVTFSALLELIRIQHFSIYYSDDHRLMIKPTTKGVDSGE